MKRGKLFIVWCLAIAVVDLYGQSVVLRVTPTFSTYSMQGLKDLQTQLATIPIGVPLEVVTNFPAWVGFNAELGLSKNTNEWSAYYAYNSTGGRIHYADYSGEYSLDQPVFAHTFGFGLHHRLGDGNSALSIGGRLGLAFTTLDIRNTIVINDQVVAQESVTFQSLNVHLNPQLRYEYRWARVMLVADLGFLLGVLKGPLSLGGDGDVTLVGVTDNQVKADWGGLRVALGVGYRLN